MESVRQHGDWHDVLALLTCGEDDITPPLRRRWHIGGTWSISVTLKAQNESDEYRATTCCGRCYMREQCHQIITSIPCWQKHRYFPSRTMGEKEVLIIKYELTGLHGCSPRSPRHSWSEIPLHSLNHLRVLPASQASLDESTPAGKANYIHFSWVKLLTLS